MPFQVGFEYHEELSNVLAALRSKHKQFNDVLADGLNKLRGAFADYWHPFIREKVLAAIDATGAKLTEEFAKEEWTLERLNERAERVRERVEMLYQDDQVGPPFSASELDAICKEGERRYNEKIPPGFKDVRKSKSRRRPYGDLIIWKQMIQRAKETAKPIVFVTDDSKEDWWLRIAGETKGPLPELRAEILTESGQDFHMYSSQQFLRYSAPIFLKRVADDSAIQEIERGQRAEQLHDSAVSSSSSAVAYGRHRWLGDQPSQYDPAIATSQMPEWATNPDFLEAIRAGSKVPAWATNADILEKIFGNSKVPEWATNPEYLEKLLGVSKVPEWATNAEFLEKMLGGSKVPEWATNAEFLEKMLGGSKVPEWATNPEFLEKMLGGSKVPEWATNPEFLEKIRNSPKTPKLGDRDSRP
jgi:hypothetical protein